MGPAAAHNACSVAGISGSGAAAVAKRSAGGSCCAGSLRSALLGRGAKGSCEVRLSGAGGTSACVEGGAAAHCSGDFGSALTAATRGRLRGAGCTNDTLQAHGKA